MRLKVITFLVSVLFATVYYFYQPSPALAVKSSSNIMAIFSFSGKQPTDLGVKKGLLADCPNSPNCVSSYSTDKAHQIEALAYESTPEDALSKLKEIIQNEKNAKVVTEEKNYLYAQYTSGIMGFVDDVEFYVDEAAGTIQVRSASRLGESDLGVNRKRIEAIRKEFNA